jgi:hypothetical protein
MNEAIEKSPSRDDDGFRANRSRIAELDAEHAARDSVVRIFLMADD